MLYAIVDIETSGSQPANHGITEIAIVLYDGKEVEGRFSTLINPGVAIDPYVVGLTGITDEMVAKAPAFWEVAPKIESLLKGRIFVAHNVNFDFSFIQHYMVQAGKRLTNKRLCTIRLARKAFPGLRKYGLNALCEQLDIQNEDRHRALGDAMATTELLESCIQQMGESGLQEMLSAENQEQSIPPAVPVKDIQALTEGPGVYYFKDSQGKILYIGKSKTVKKRVLQHFKGLDLSAKKQALLREVSSISCTPTPSEWLASMLEIMEIKRCWPKWNRSQRFHERIFALISFEDQMGYVRLAIDRWNKKVPSYARFYLPTDAYQYLRELIRQFQLDPYLCFLHTLPNEELPDPVLYNERVQKAIQHTLATRKTFLLKQDGYLLLVEQGLFYGMTEDTGQEIPSDLEDIKLHIQPAAASSAIEKMIQNSLQADGANIMFFS